MANCSECSGTGVAERIGGYDRPCDVCRGDGRLAAWTPPMTNPNHTDTSRSGDLVKRLRKRREVEIIGGYERIEWEDEDALEAADRLEALEAEIERLRKMLPRMERVKGRDIDEWRSNLSPELYRAGDAVICWVNEGDEIAVSLARAALGEKQ